MKSSSIDNIRVDSEVVDRLMEGYKTQIRTYAGVKDVYGKEIITKGEVEEHLKEINNVIVDVLQGLKISDAIVTEILNTPLSEKIGCIEIREQIKEKVKAEGLYREFDGVEYVLSVNGITNEVVGVETLEEYFEKYYKERVIRMSDISKVGYKIRKLSYKLRDRVEEEIKNK